MAKKTASHRTRIYKLAKAIGIDTKELLIRIKRDFGIEKSSSLDTIEIASAEIIKRKILGDLKLEKANQKTPEQRLREVKSTRRKKSVKSSKTSKSEKSPKKSAKPTKKTAKPSKPTRKRSAASKDEQVKKVKKVTRAKKGKPSEVSETVKPKRRTKKVSKKTPAFAAEPPTKKVFTPPTIKIKKETIIKKKYKKKKKDSDDSLTAPSIIKIPQNITVSSLSETLGVETSDMIDKLMQLGITANITQRLDEEAIIMVSSEFGFDIEIEEIFKEPVLEVADKEVIKGLPRSPIVTVMGHVDHGKTTLLDVLRNTSVVDKEVGKITQKIGASILQTPNGEIVFLDTPGHEAFTTIRARGAQVTDIVILVVAADDGIMPQTIEAINHSKAAGIPIIVAINKIDVSNANIDKVKTELSEQGLVPDSWGGNTTCIEISALKKINLEDLVTAIQLEAEHLDLTAPIDVPASGTIIEAKRDKRFGNVGSLIVLNGTLQIGQTFVCGLTYGRVRMMFSDKGERLKSVLPATPIELVGFNDLPEPGDMLSVVKNEKTAKQMIQERKNKLRTVTGAVDSGQEITLEDLYSTLEFGEVKLLNLIVKCDSVGSLEAVISSLDNFPSDKIKLNVIHKGIGGITDNDVKLAQASSDTIIIAFDVPLMSRVHDFAKREGIQIKQYNIIYHLIEEIKLAMEGLLSPIEKEVVLGHSEVRDIFKISRLGTIAGCFVLDGVIKKSNFIRVQRNEETIFSGTIE
ncbi:translation initiation factor IF-2 [Candidatus Dependentiae bacterium]|nr:translation initiation factor IF-2 [Candidatus Dependentiae bacterium]